MKKIYLILIISFLTRIYGITSPIIGWHSWRQADTASIAKNYYENGYNFINPQINWGGNTSGIVESEFPIYPFMAALLYKILGFNELWGRLLSVLFSTLSVFGIFLLVKLTINIKTALFASFAYSILPLNIFYGRAFMPEAMILFTSVFGIYFFLKWSDTEKLKYYILACLFVISSALVKLTSLYILFIFLFYTIHQRKMYSFYWKTFLFFVIIIFSVSIWYYHAHNLYESTGLTFGIWKFSGDKWFSFNTVFNLKFFNDIFLVSLAERHLTYSGFILFFIGLFISRNNIKEYVFDYWIIAVLIYFFVVAKGNQVHEYYQLPFVFPASVFIGKLLSRFFNKSALFSISKDKYLRFFIWVLIISLPFLSFYRLQRLYNSENKNQPLFSASAKIDDISEKEDLIISVCDGNPVYLYNFDRKGWIVTGESLTITLIEKHKSLGAKYLIADNTYLIKTVDEATLNDLYKRYIVINKIDFLILKL